MRGVWGIVALAGLLSGSATAQAAGGARVAMPFACVAEQGRVKLQSAADHVYDVAGKVESQSFVVCLTPGGACRPVMLYRFSVQCPGGRVPWLDIAAAAAALRPALRVEVDDGRLVVGRSRPPVVRLVRNCYDRLSGSTARIRVFDQTVLDECWAFNRIGPSVPGPAPTAKIALPAGYAPLNLARARLLPPAAAASSVALAPAVEAVRPQPSMGSASPVAAGDEAETPQQPVARFAMRAPEEAPAAEMATVLPVVSSGWRTEVKIEPMRPKSPASVQEQREPPGEIQAMVAAEPRSWPLSALFGGAVALLSAAALTGLLLARQRFGDPAVAASKAKDSVALRPAPAASDRGGLAAALSMKGPDARAVDQLKATAEELLPLVRQRLDGLSPVMPLRQVLARELSTITQRHATFSGETPATPEQWRRTRARLSTIVRDLQRLGEIAEGAHSSLGTGAVVPAELPEPRDKAEAYAMLGVNPDVEERIMKKLVDALRQSWHPDLARDDADRERREQKIKQINVAWDLVQGKRGEG